MEVLRYIALGFYLVALLGTLFYFRLHRLDRPTGLALVTVLALFLAWGLQGIELGLAVTGGPAYGRPPDAFELVAWVLAFSFLLVSLSARFFKASPLFLSAILAFIGFSHTIGNRFPLSLEASIQAGAWWGELHILFFSLGFAVLTVTVLIGMLYVTKEWSLKHKRFAAMEGIPPLDSLYVFFRLFLWVGFLLFTGGLLSGGGWSKILYGVYLSSDPKEYLTLVTWLLYAAAVNLQLLPSWRGRRTILLSYVAFALLVTSIVGVSHRI